MRLIRAVARAVLQQDGEGPSRWHTNFCIYDLLHCIPPYADIREWALEENRPGWFLCEGDIAHVFCRSRAKGHRERLEALEALAVRRGVKLVRHLM